MLTKEKSASPEAAALPGTSDSSKKSAQKTKPAFDRTKLHPDANKAVVMNSSGDWFSYSRVPTLEDDRWVKPAEAMCLRIPASRAPEWTGDWQESLIVFDAVA